MIVYKIISQCKNTVLTNDKGLMKTNPFWFHIWHNEWPSDLQLDFHITISVEPFFTLNDCEI